MKKPLIINIFLALILVLALFWRVYALDNVPPALFGDEIDVGYQAYSLLHTGKDLYGNTMPFYLHSLSEYRTSLYIYSAVPFVGLFGLNEWGVRLPAVFWGIISIIGMYLLVKKMFGVRVSLIASFLISISPWHLQYSRASFEVTMLLVFLIFAIYFFLLGLERARYFVMSLVLFVLSIYIYSTAVAFVPLIFGCLILINYRKFNIKFLRENISVVGVMIIIGLILVLPLIYSLYSGVAKERFSLISIFSESVLLDKINHIRSGLEYYNYSGEKITVPGGLESIFHNKYLIFSQILGQNYFRAFSFDFLFSSGDPNFRQSIGEMGVLYIFDFFAVILGLIYLYKSDYKLEKRFIISWLLLAPIPAALTQGGGFHATRLILMLPPIMVLSALGVNWLSRKYSRINRVFFIGLCLILVVNFSLYIHRYYAHYPIESWRFWQVGYKQAITDIEKYQGQYKTVVINNSYEPGLIRYAFFTKYDPAKFAMNINQRPDKVSENILEGVDGFKFDDKLYFGSMRESTMRDGGFDRVMKPGMLYLAARSEVDGDDLRYKNSDKFKVLDTIFNPLGVPIFFILGAK